jgi:hypothetical protein
MSEEHSDQHRVSDATLVEEEMLRAAARESADKTLGDENEFVPSEPVLSAYLHTELLAILGKLALSGAGTEIVRGVAVDLHRLIATSAGALQKGYRALIDGLLPGLGEEEVTDVQNEEPDKTDDGIPF